MSAYMSQIKDDIDTLKSIILEKIPTEEIYLFGSYAYGTPHENSDIDLYIVMKDNAQMREWDAIDWVNYERIYKVKKPVDVMALKQNRFLYRKNGRTLENTIVQKGIKIYG